MFFCDRREGAWLPAVLTCHYLITSSAVGGGGGGGIARSGERMGGGKGRPRRLRPILHHSGDDVSILSKPQQIPLNAPIRGQFRVASGYFHRRSFTCRPVEPDCSAAPQ